MQPWVLGKYPLPMGKIPKTQGFSHPVIDLYELIFNLFSAGLGLNIFEPSQLRFGLLCQSSGLLLWQMRHGVRQLWH